MTLNHESTDDTMPGLSIRDFLADRSGQRKRGLLIAGSARSYLISYLHGGDVERTLTRVATSPLLCLRVRGRRGRGLGL